jgi:hypothetical protein
MKSIIPIKRPIMIFALRTIPSSLDITAFLNFLGQKNIGAINKK